MAADHLSGDAGSEHAPTSVFRLEKKLHCEDFLAAVEQPFEGVHVAEEVGDDDSPYGRFFSLAVMPSFYAAKRFTAKSRQSLKALYQFFFDLDYPLLKGHFSRWADSCFRD